MLLKNLLRPSLIKTGLEGKTSGAVIGEVLDLLVQDIEVAYALRNSVFDEVMDHECETPGGKEAGVAIPTAVTTRVDDLLCALGIAPEGVPFESIDGKPCNVILLILVPRNAYDDRVHTLEAAAEVFGDPKVLAQLTNASSAQEAYNIIAKVEEANETR